MLPEQQIAVAIAFFIGILLGAMGSGGSIVMLPVLVYVAGISPQSAIPMSMVIIGSASVLAAYLHARRGNFHTKLRYFWARPTLFRSPGTSVSARLSCVARHLALHLLRPGRLLGGRTRGERS